MANDITVDFNANLARFEKGVKKATSQLNSFGKSARSVGRGIKTFIAGALAKFSVDMVKSSIETADAIAKTADKIGLTTDALQELRFAAARTGVAQRALDMGMQRFSRRVGEVAQGTGVLKSVFDQYGIAVKDAEGNMRPLQDILLDYSDTIKKAGGAQEQLRLAFKAFDSEGAALVNTLKGGRQGLEFLTQAARDSGAVMEEELVRRAEKINDRWDTLTNTISVKLKSAILSSASFIAGDTLSATEKQAALLNNRIKELNKNIEFYQERINELQASGDDTLSPAIEKYQASLKAAQEEVKNLGGAVDSLRGKEIMPDALTKLRQAIEGANTATQKFAETQKLFKKQKAPFAENATATEQVLKTYRLLSEATSAARAGAPSDVIAEKAEAAAAAINKLKESGKVAQVTIDDMKRMLQDLVTSGDKPDVEIDISIDENGILSATDEATRLAMEHAKANPVIIPVELEVTQAVKQINDLRAGVAGGGADIEREAEKAGGLP